jgi:hypothetical protein
MTEEFKPKTELIPIISVSNFILKSANDFIPIVFNNLETVKLEEEIKKRINDELYHNDTNAVIGDLKILFEKQYKKNKNSNPNHKRLALFIFYYILRQDKNKKHWDILKEFIKKYPTIISKTAIIKMAKIGFTLNELIKLNKTNTLEGLVELTYPEIFERYTEQLTILKVEKIQTYKYKKLETNSSNKIEKLIKDVYDLITKYFENT